MLEFAFVKLLSKCNTIKLALKVHPGDISDIFVLSVEENFVCRKLRLPREIAFKI